MQDHELDALLGPTAGDVTDEQRDTIRAAAARIEARWPDDDLGNLREQARNTALAVILGDETLAETGAAYVRAREVERETHAALTGALIAQAAIAPTTAEQTLAETAGVTRLTVRKALGK